MEPLYRELELRAKKHPSFWQFVREHLTSHYLNERMRAFGEDEHVRRVLQRRNGLFDVSPDLFRRLHEEQAILSAFLRSPVVARAIPRH